MILNPNSVMIWSQASGNYLALKATDYGAVIVGEMPTSHPRTDKAYLWDIVPFFSSRMAYIGLGVRSSLNGLYLGQRSPADGGGVGLVSSYDADDSETWQINPAGAGFMPFTLGPTYGTNLHCDLTIKGGGPWKAGDQVITYHWNGNVQNQLWAVRN